jgi:hypothetical protein
MSCTQSEIFNTFIDSLAVIGAFSIIAFAVCLMLFSFAYWLPKKDID